MKTSQNHNKNEHLKPRTLMPNGCQKGHNIDAKTHPKSMPIYVSTNIMKIIENQVFLNGKIIRVHCKNNFFLKVLLVACANGKKVSNKYQKCDPNQSLNRYKIDVETMLKQNDANIIET